MILQNWLASHSHLPCSPCPLYTVKPGSTEVQIIYVYPKQIIQLYAYSSICNHSHHFHQYLSALDVYHIHQL